MNYYSQLLLLLALLLLEVIAVVVAITTITITPDEAQTVDFPPATKNSKIRQKLQNFR